MKKEEFLESNKMELCGKIYRDPVTNIRATVDEFGRVQWWDVDGSGRMVAQTDGIENGAEIIYE